MSLGAASSHQLPKSETSKLRRSCRDLECEILSYKRFDPFMPHARLLAEFFDRKGWRDVGFDRKLDWLKARYPESYLQTYVLFNIAKRLGPFLSDDLLHGIGISKCDELARLTKDGKAPQAEDVLQAQKLTYKDFERYVESRLTGKRFRQQFGEYWPSAFRGLQHAPTNELGVVYLFGVISDELGFIVESIKPGFPDCTAKRRIPGKREKWESVRIEFEFASGNFNHPTDGADLVVCWQHDWKDCPVEVLELKKAVQKLPKQIRKTRKRNYL